MKLWEKNYLLTMAIFLIILYGSIFFVHSFSFKTSLEKECEHVINMEKSTSYGIESLITVKENAFNSTKLLLYGESLKEQSIYIYITMKEDVLVDTFPFEIDADTDRGSYIIERNQSHYILISDNLTLEDDNIIKIYYMESIEEVYVNSQRQMIFWLLICGILSIFVAIVLHISMKKIYQPINNIAHELRTPLTTIQGYAQYISIGKINQEDILYASEKIDEEAVYINNLIERLLVMEHISDGEIVLEKIYTEDIFVELKKYYPNIQTNKESEHISCDKTLLLSLLLNLISNLSRSEGKIILTVSENKIILQNSNDYIKPLVLKKINSNSKLPREVINGKGLGVALCHDIIKMHGWKIQYKSSLEDGTEITINCIHKHSVFV